MRVSMWGDFREIARAPTCEFYHNRQSTKRRHCVGTPNATSLLRLFDEGSGDYSRAQEITTLRTGERGGESIGRLVVIFFLCLLPSTNLCSYVNWLKVGKHVSCAVMSEDYKKLRRCKPFPLEIADCYYLNESEILTQIMWSFIHIYPHNWLDIFI